VGVGQDQSNRHFAKTGRSLAWSTVSGRSTLLCHDNDSGVGETIGGRGTALCCIVKNDAGSVTLTGP